MKKGTVRLAVLTAALATLFAATPAGAQQKKTTLGLDAAKKMAAACEQHARKEGWNMVIAIVDDGGTLKHFSRMDNAFRASVDISQLKANTSSGFPRSTRQVGEIARERAPGIVHVPGIVTFAGGLPIVTATGEHIGAIGVSGGTSDQDEVCAQAGLDAVKSELNLK
ncbi:MAG: hypothetical protein RL404_1984 [Pseudomonadota bacterium]|jgi:uncharacterized protein GlcG (DUF336 family)